MSGREVTIDMSENTNLDPNSGAAPQPGGYAGPQGAAKGFAGAELGNVEEEVSPADYVAPGGTGTPGGGFPSLESVVAAEQGVVPEEDVEEESDEDDDSGNSRVPPVADEGGEDVYDPSQYTVAQVQEFLEAHPDQYDAVVASEKKGKNRQGIVGE